MSNSVKTEGIIISPEEYERLKNAVNTLEVLSEDYKGNCHVIQQAFGAWHEDKRTEWLYISSADSFIVEKLSVWQKEHDDKLEKVTADAERYNERGLKPAGEAYREMCEEQIKDLQLENLIKNHIIGWGFSALIITVFVLL